MDLRLSALLAMVAVAACYSSSTSPDGGDGACRSDEHCLDDDPCNGRERCGPDGVCLPGTPPTTPTTCDDGNACTTGDHCATGACVAAGPPPDCDDGDPCTADRCEPATGCVHDPLAVIYRDGDGDGFGTAETACVPIEEIPAGYARVGGDCLDSDPLVHPNAPDFRETPYVADSSGTLSFDYNCDGREEQQFPETLACEVTGGLCNGGSYASGWCADPAVDPGCVGVPSCGATGVFQDGCLFGPPAADAGTGGGKSLDAGSSAPPEESDDERDATAKETPPRDMVDTSGWTCTPFGVGSAIQACR